MCALCAVCAVCFTWIAASRVDAQDIGLQSPLPSLDAAQHAFDVAAAWLSEFTLPPLDENDAQVAIEDATGVCVVLRSAGRVVGVGADWTGDDLMLRRAIGRALSQVLGDVAAGGDHLISPDRAAGDDGRSTDANQDAKAAQAAERAAMQELIRSGLGRRLTMELEVSGPLTPLLGRTFDQIALRLEPGLDGVALRAGERFTYRFPAQMRANNSADAIGRVPQSLAFQLTLPRESYEELMRNHDVAAYRFRTRSLIQDQPGGDAIVRFRGDDLIALEDVTIDSIRKAADGIAMHLLASRFPGGEPLGLMGSYRPVADEHTPFIAPPLEQALGAWALAIYADAPGIKTDAAALARNGAIELLQELAAQDVIETNPTASPIDCAAIVLACDRLSDALEHAGVRGMYDQALTTLVTMQDADGVFRVVSDDGQPPRAVSAQAQSLMACALARRLAAGETQVRAERARQAIDAAWTSPQVVSMMPWLGWAEMAYAQATDEPIAHAEELIQLRQLLHAGRLGTADRPAPPDVAGGFALTEGTGNRATAQTARPAAMLANMLNIVELTPVDGLELAISDHRETLRFLMQLTIREGLAGSLRNSTRAIGGVRQAPWNTDQPLAAQAMTLAALAESLTALNRLGWSGH